MKEFELTNQGLKELNATSQTTDVQALVDQAVLNTQLTNNPLASQAKVIVTNPTDHNEDAIIVPINIASTSDPQFERQPLSRDPLLETSQSLVPISKRGSTLEVVDIDHSLIKLIDGRYARANLILPLSKNGNLLQVAYCDPTKKRSIERDLTKQGLIANFSLWPKEKLLQQIQYHYSQLAPPPPTIGRPKTAESATVKDVWRMQYDSEYVNFDDLNTTEQLNLFWSWVITESERRQATDINIDLLLSPLNPHDSRLEIRAKINGDFEVIKQQEMNSETYGQLVRIVKTKAKTDSQWQRSDQSGVFSALIEHQGRTEQLEIRANIIPTGESKAHGETISLRLQRKYNFPFTLDSLGFTREQQRLIDYILSLKDGLILVAGPVNCGKNVTLVTLLKELQRRNPEKLIATLEDPPEFILGDYAITQINIESLRKPDGTKYTFSDGLRALLRHSINYAMIGETRDADTAQILVEGARLGHGFFSTIHAQDATEAIGRLRSFGITNSDLASVLRATITQRLIKKSCPACQREPEDLKKYESLIPELKRYVDAIEWNEPITLMRSTGLDHRGLSCSQCHGKGYDGRIGIFEILLLDADELLTDLISQGAPPSQIRKAALTQSLQPDNKYRFRTL